MNKETLQEKILKHLENKAINILEGNNEPMNEKEINKFLESFKNTGNHIPITSQTEDKKYNHFRVTLSDYIEDFKVYRFFNKGVEYFQKENQVLFEFSIPISIEEFEQTILGKTKFSYIYSDYINPIKTEDPTIENKQLEDLISQIRDSFDGSVEVYTKGSCIKFCMVLKTVFPRGIIFYNSDHATFELNNRFYDITGEVAKPNNSIPIEEYGILKCYELMNLKYSIKV